MLKSKSKTRGFTLIEMVISVGILAILSVGILRLFVVSQVNHQKAVDLDHAVLISNSLIEEFKGMKGLPESDSSFTVYYDRNWEQSTMDAAQYAVYGKISPLSDGQGGLFNMDLQAVRLTPYPLEDEASQEIYKMGCVIENLSWWGESR